MFDTYILHEELAKLTHYQQCISANSKQHNTPRKYFVVYKIVIRKKLNFDLYVKIIKKTVFNIVKIDQGAKNFFH